MNMQRLAMVLAMIPILCTSGGVKSFEEKVQRDRDRIVQRQDTLLNETLGVDAELRARNVVSPAIAAATNLLGRMSYDSAAWRGLESRSDRIREQAKAKLASYLAQADKLLGDARRELAPIKQAEYDAWARANPEAAKLDELQKSIRHAGEVQAEAIRDQTREASFDAHEARLQAHEEARQQALRPANQAQDSAFEIEQIKTSLRNRGITPGF